jgi:uncharacterized YigZ family protein
MNESATGIMPCSYYRTQTSTELVRSNGCMGRKSRNQIGWEGNQTSASRYCINKACQKHQRADNQIFNHRIISFNCTKVVILFVPLHSDERILQMTQEDTYKTITDLAEGLYTEKRSKFIAIAIPVRTLEEVKQHLEVYQKKYYDARHVCYAYMLGHERLNFRANDNGEPSGTAGKPILGQINSNELTDILIIVVRYFGGIKLGTSGLIVAYKAAAAEAIAASNIIEKTVDDDVYFAFEYPFMNDVMRIVKEEEPEILEQAYDMDCLMRLRIRRSMMPKLRARLEKVDSLRFLDEE